MCGCDRYPLLEYPTALVRRVRKSQGNHRWAWVGKIPLPHLDAWVVIHTIRLTTHQQAPDGNARYGKIGDQWILILS
jgi:hypothetical protein